MYSLAAAAMMQALVLTFMPVDFLAQVFRVGHWRPAFADLETFFLEATLEIDFRPAIFERVGVYFLWLKV